MHKFRPHFLKPDPSNCNGNYTTNIYCKFLQKNTIFTNCYSCLISTKVYNKYLETVFNPFVYRTFEKVWQVLFLARHRPSSAPVTHETSHAQH